MQQYTKMVDGELFLNDEGREVINRGGADDLDDDGMLILELIAKLDGVSQVDLQTIFISAREGYGEDARAALKDGSIRFEKRVQ